MAFACNPRYSGGWGKKIVWTCEAEVALSQDRTIALQPGWQSEIPSQKKSQLQKINFQGIKTEGDWREESGNSYKKAIGGIHAGRFSIFTVAVDIQTYIW